MYTVEKVKVAFNSFFLPTPNRCLPNTRGKEENNKGSLDIWYLHTNITWKKFDAIVCKKWTWSQLLKRSINNMAASTPHNTFIVPHWINRNGCGTNAKLFMKQ